MPDRDRAKHLAAFADLVSRSCLMKTSCNCVPTGYGTFRAMAWAITGSLASAGIGAMNVPSGAIR